MLLRIYLVTALTVLGAYTGTVGLEHGWNLLAVFFADLAAMTWPGQFNLDFMTFLGLSALWVSWRHQFSAGGIALGVLAFFGGMIFLATYLLIGLSQTRGNIPALLLGPHMPRTEGSAQ